VGTLGEGLSEAAVRERVLRGEVNEVPRRASRTIGQIVRANLLTPFNALLGSLFVLIMLTGAVQDALFGIVLIANMSIGIVQELRAKRTLDRLAVLTTPQARVVREANLREIPVEQVVLDDVLELRPGDQIVVDGVVLASDGLEIDESLLSGEAEPLSKDAGDQVLSGSFVAAGTGRIRSTRVGEAAYASQLAAQAKRFAPVRSELRDGINRLLVYVTWAIVPTAALLFVSQFRLADSWHDGIAGAVAGTVGMVPEGLVLLTSIAFAVAVVRLAGRRVLVQELPAVEGLARVDVLCTDKTGTLTEGRLVVQDLETLAEGTSGADLKEALAQLAAADPAPNATMAAIGSAYPLPATRWSPIASVPFSSARKWSAKSFGTRGTWVLGAPEVLLDAAAAMGRWRAVADRVQALAEGGRRVLLLGSSETTLSGETLPADLAPLGLLVVQDRVRADAPATLRYFERQGVDVKVISGDDAVTVAAIAAEAGLQASGEPVDARSLPEDAGALGDALQAHSVFGRVTPQQKRAMIGALQARGHVVAMTGDGVNDVLALKDADIGVAMGSGSAASRGAAQLVLLDSSFAALPVAVAEGRRVIANIERTGNLFLTKTVYAMLLAIAVGVAGVPFPFLPRHLTLVSLFTIGIPGFFLALAPSDRPARTGFIGRILRFAVPAGILAAGGTFAAYALARELELPLAVAQTTATIVLFAIGLVVLAAIASPMTALRAWLVAGMGAAFVAVMVVPSLREFFALTLPPTIVWLVAGVIALAVAPAVWWLIRRTQRTQEPMDRAALRRALGLEASGSGSVEGRRRRLIADIPGRARARLAVAGAWVRRRFDPAIPRGLPLTFTIASTLAAAWIFGELTRDVLRHEDTVLFDPRVTDLVVAHRMDWLTPIVQAVTRLGSNLVILPTALVVGGVFMIRRRDWRPLVLLGAAAIGAVLLYDIVKALVGRPRPPSSIWIGHFSGSAFPSGHTTASVAFYAMLALVLSIGAPVGRRALLWTGAALVAVAVGGSRVYLGAHWLTDVLAGGALGAAWVGLLIVVALLAAAPSPRSTIAAEQSGDRISRSASGRTAA
jgi:magnesium-transporting ATPase (P-type)/membrane-associated phospholipid phosphatase